MLCFFFLTFQSKSQTILKKRILIDIISFKTFPRALFSLPMLAGILQDLESGPGSSRVIYPSLQHQLLHPFKGNRRVSRIQNTCRFYCKKSRNLAATTDRVTWPGSKKHLHFLSERILVSGYTGLQGC